jgi:hypothetical protein
MSPRLASAIVLMALVGTVNGCAPPNEPPVEVNTRFTDPFGRSPTRVVLSPGRSIEIRYTDSSFLKLPVQRQHREAQEMARAAWKQFGRMEEVDTVRVTFADRAPGGQHVRRKEASYFFYRPQLERGATAVKRKQVGG